MSDPFDRGTEADELFARALELAGERRAAFVAEVCGDDRELSEAVERLLGASEEGDSFLEPGGALRGLGLEDLFGPVPAGGPTAPGFRSGQWLGHYRIVGLLGEGGMGQVYAAEDSELGRRVALKVLPVEMAGDAKSLQRFRREAQAVAALNHPNVVTIHSVEEEDHIHFLTMELITGQRLDRLIPEEGMDLRELLRLGADLADGLRAAHEKGITHRDLKPANAMVDEDRRVRILDFGLARPRAAPPDGPGRESSGPTARPGAVVGTVPYMSPEQLAGKAVDHRSDIFSLGVILYEMCTGRRPFQGKSSAHVISAILHHTPPPVTELNPCLPERLGGIVRRCLEKEREHRYPSAREVRDALQDLERQLARQVESVASPAAAPDRRSLGTVVTLVVLGTLAIAGSWLRWDSGLESRPGLDPARVVVAPFENRIEEPDFDKLGLMAADWVTQGLSQIETLEVVPTQAVRDAMRAIEEGETGDSANRLQALAEDTGGGTVVWGTCSLGGDTLALRAEVFDAVEGKLIHALDTVTGNRDNPMEVIERLQQQVMGAIAAGSDFLAPWRPPTFEAYREFWLGMERWDTDFAAAARHFRRSAELDPEFLAARLHLTAALGLLGRPAESEAMLLRLEAGRERFGRFERLFLDFFRAKLDGRSVEALGILRQLQAMAPQNSQVNYLVASQALFVNRPQETVDTLSKMGHPFAHYAVGERWLDRLTTALHLLGEHTRELAEAREGRELYPDELFSRFCEVRALAALGRIDEIRQAIDESLTVPPVRWTAGQLMRRGAEELRAHGHTEVAREIAERALAWYQGRPAEEAESPANRRARAGMLSLLGHASEAYELFQALAAERPDELAYQTRVGTLAARLGNREEATRISKALQSLDRPHLRGRNLSRAAGIEALLGEKARAVDLLRESFARGNSYGIYLHVVADFEPLRDFPSFVGLVRPKG